jgi:amino acid permease
MSDEALVELVRIHSKASSWTDRISRRAQPFWERFAMAAIVVFLFAISLLETEWSLILSRTSVSVWPVLAIFVALVISCVVEGVRLSGQSTPRRLRARLATPLFFGGASLVVGFGGFAIDFYLTLWRMVGDPEHAAAYFVRALLGGTTTLMVAFLVALCSALVWFIFAGRVARVEQNAVKTVMEV